MFASITPDMNIRLEVPVGPYEVNAIFEPVGNGKFSPDEIRVFRGDLEVTGTILNHDVFFFSSLEELTEVIKTVRKEVQHG